MKIRDITFIEGIPNALDDNALLPVTKNNLLIIDDVMKDASSNAQVEKVFTQYVHHRNLSAIYLVQNLFFQGQLYQRQPSKRPLVIEASGTHLIPLRRERERESNRVIPEGGTRHLQRQNSAFENSSTTQKKL